MFTRKSVTTPIAAIIFAVSTFLAVAPSAFSDVSTGDKIKEDAKDVKTNAKEMGREASDKTCAMVNGKMQCTAKKAKHALQNTGDKMKDKMDKASDEAKSK